MPEMLRVGVEDFVLQILVLDLGGAEFIFGQSGESSFSSCA